MAIKRKSVTMKDVANSVGVSKQTVSAVINNKPGITEETRERVLAAIEALGYRRDSIARSLRTGSTRTIALIASDVSSPFIGEMAATVEEYMHHCGYSLILYNTHDDVEREASYFNDAVERAVDGVIFVSATDDNRGLATLESANIPYVAVDRVPYPYTGPSVTLDNLQAGLLAGQHLVDLGHTRIAHITGPSWLLMTRERLSGLQQAVEYSGGISDVLIENADDWTCEQGYIVAKRILDRQFRPTAIFAAGDLLAIGGMHALREAGLHVPNDVSVIGLDDLAVAAFQNPPLTTIRQSLSELAALGAELLFAFLDEKEIEQTAIVMKPELIVRRSTAPLT